MELELVSDPTAPIISSPYTFPHVAATRWTEDQPAVEVFDATDISIVWDISDVQCKCDVIQLDNNLNDEYVKCLLSGKSLAINYNTYISQMQTVSTPNNSVNITRSVSRLKSMCKPYD